MMVILHPDVNKKFSVILIEKHVLDKNCVSNEEIRHHNTQL